VSQGSNQMARHFGHQRYRPPRIRFRTSTGDQPHSRHGLATTAGFSISSSSDLPGQEEEPSRPRTLTPLTRHVSRSRALRVAVQVGAVTERDGGACQMSFGGLSCDSATYRLRTLDAFTVQGNGDIYLVDGSELPRGAQAGSAFHRAALPAAIGHEMAHLNGADGREARKAESKLWTSFVRDGRTDQLTALRYLNGLEKRPDHTRLASR
jgi:hypothetical protein